MDQPTEKALLPNGLHDTLAPEAAHAAAVVGRILATFAAHGYDCVRPPLVEFEESLLEGPGSAVAGQMFRLMDPVSHRMMGLRPDITPQVARIATTRLAGAARPLRLSYSGPVLQVGSTELRPEREITQAGIELIGSAALTADAEVIAVAAEALAAAGISEPSFDLTTPQLVPLVCKGLGMGADATARARTALDRKDAGALAAVKGIGATEQAMLAGLLAAAGPAEQALAAMDKLGLPREAAELAADLATIVASVREARPELSLTVDPVEFRGAEYQTGISFTIFARSIHGELGRGGRYPLGANETATGATLFLDTLLPGVPPPEPAPTLYVPFATTGADGTRLRSEGWRTVRGLEAEGDPALQARRLGCSHLWDGSQARPLG